MKNTLFRLFLLVLMSAVGARAAWQKFDDFESGNLDKWVFTQSNVGTTADSKVEIVVDPDPAGAAAGNHVMLMYPGSPYESDHRSRLISVGFPAINYGTTGTAFFRWYTKMVNVGGTLFAPEIDFNVGMSTLEVPSEYAHSGPVTGYDVGEAQFRAYDGDPNPANPSTVTGFQNMLVNRPNDVWVSQWFYIRNYDVANQRQDYQVYYRVGTSGTPILGYPFVPGEYAGFRMKVDGDLDPNAAHMRTFYFTNSAGNIAGPQALDAAIFCDDVYIDQNGINLSDPLNAATAAPLEVTKLVNIATRGEVLTGDKILIAGFVIEGDSPQQVLIRAVGPTLGTLGVAGSLSAPVLTLFQGQTVIGTNTQWGTAANAAAISTAAASVGAFALATGSADSCMLVTLQPGSYTAQVSGAGGATGVALVEVYSVAQ